MVAPLIAAVFVDTRINPQGNPPPEHCDPHGTSVFGLIYRTLRKERGPTGVGAQWPDGADTHTHM